MLIGAALVVSGLAGIITRQAQLAEDHRRSLELTASLSAARLDASVAEATTTLSLAGPQPDLDRLSSALGVAVCAVGERIECARPAAGSGRTAGLDDLDDLEGFVDRVVDDPARQPDRRSESDAPLIAVTVAAGGESDTARAILTTVDHGNQLLVAVRGLSDVRVVADSAIDIAGGDSFAARLGSDVAGGPWWVEVIGGRRHGLTTGEKLFTAVQLLVGAVLIAGFSFAVARDHRGLRRRATTDALTGLPNRAEFEQLAVRALGELPREGRAGCLIVIDLDGFKSINDTIGHAAGDRVLVRVGRRLAGAVRPSDLVGRWGGDEFVLLLTGVGDPSALPERVLAISASLADVSGSDGARLTASVGAALFPRDGHDLVTLLEVADRAMYVVKSGTGRQSPTLGHPADRQTGSGRPKAPVVPWRS